MTQRPNAPKARSRLNGFDGLVLAGAAANGLAVLSLLIYAWLH